MSILQAGTKENTANEVEMKEIEGPVLAALVSHMYGRPIENSDILLPLFVAADAHQVCYSWQVSCMINSGSSTFWMAGRKATMGLSATAGQ